MGKMPINVNSDFPYYIVDKTAEDLRRDNITKTKRKYEKQETKEKDKEREDLEERRNGFWVRNNNFLTKRADFLEKPGPGRRLINMPLRNRVLGEIYHRDINRFLTINLAVKPVFAKPVSGVTRKSQVVI
jgi:hypothetical protein